MEREPASREKGGPAVPKGGIVIGQPARRQTDEASGSTFEFADRSITRIIPTEFDGSLMNINLFL